MEDKKSFELNNKAIKDFDKIMTYHLDEVETLTIKEAFTNSKLYNIVSLCINIKTLIIEGDLRVDVNKIISNICKPESLKTLILNSVKLPTTKSILRFTGLETISLTNITFSNINSFFEKLPNKEKIEALNMTNCDLGKKSISLCKMFPNLKLLNLDSLINATFDDFSFITENNSFKRLDFFGNEIISNCIKDLTKRKYEKNIDLKLKTISKTHIDNSIEIENEKISITINLSELDNLINVLPLVKVENLYLVLDSKTDINELIKRIKKVKGKVTIITEELYYLDVDDVKLLNERLKVDNIEVLDYDNRKVKSYPFYEYIKIRERFNNIIKGVDITLCEKEKFMYVYKYLRDNITYEESKTCDIKTFFMENRSNYNLYSNVLKNLLLALNIKVNTIKGYSLNDTKLNVWNQVMLDGKWYNVDLGADAKRHKFNKKDILMDDDEFYKNHIPKSGVVKKCTPYEFKGNKNKTKNKEITKNEKINFKKKSLFKRFKDK